MSYVLFLYVVSLSLSLQSKEASNTCHLTGLLLLKVNS